MVCRAVLVEGRAARPLSRLLQSFHLVSRCMPACLECRRREAKPARHRRQQLLISKASSRTEQLCPKADRRGQHRTQREKRLCLLHWIRWRGVARTLPKMLVVISWIVDLVRHGGLRRAIKRCLAQ